MTHYFFVLYTSLLGCSEPKDHAVEMEKKCVPGTFNRVQTSSLSTENFSNFHSMGYIGDPFVLRNGNGYEMWLSGYDTTTQQLGIAHTHSNDGILWEDTLSTESGITLAFAPSGWDRNGIEMANVIEEENGFRLFYASFDDQNVFSIGTATSADGHTWSREGDGPVLVPELEWEQPFLVGESYFGGVLEPSVLFENDVYRMWYSGWGEYEGRWGHFIGYAESDDAQTWTKESSPVFLPEPDAWDDAVVTQAHVVPDPVEGYHLFYMGQSESDRAFCNQNECAANYAIGHIGHAYSVDGFTWTRNPNNPILSPKDGQWDAWMTYGPTAIIQDNEVWLWYFALAEYNEYNAGIGLAKTTCSSIED
ncbi:MAG: hypothetical protein VX278_02840 [Myxococcota bacterium]|nr:hypothetical protein [Myxococcota bacterium]